MPSNRFDASDSRVASIIDQLGRSLFGLAIDPQRLRILDDVSKAAGSADDYLDTLPDGERRAFAKSVLAYIAGGEDRPIEATQPASRDIDRLREITETLDSKDRERLLRGLSNFLRATEIVRYAPTGRALLRWTMVECQAAARVYVAVLAFPGAPVRKVRQFQRMLVRLGRAVGAVDTGYDLPADFAAGHTVVPPTLRTRVMLVVAAIQQSAPTILRMLAHPKALNAVLTFQIREWTRRH